MRWTVTRRGLLTGARHASGIAARGQVCISHVPGMFYFTSARCEDPVELKLAKAPAPGLEALRHCDLSRAGGAEPNDNRAFRSFHRLVARLYFAFYYSPTRRI
jgi:hypothetical protein